MSKFNRITGEFVPDDASNVVDPSDPKTGEVSVPNIVGPEDQNHPGRYLRGPDFMKQQIQVGVHTVVGQGEGAEEYVCVSDSEPASVYTAYWVKVTD